MSPNKPVAEKDNREAQPPSKTEIVLGILKRFQRFSRDIAGVLCWAMALMTLAGVIFPDQTRGLLRWWIEGLRLWFGWGALWFVVFFALLGLGLLKRKPLELKGRWGRVFAFEAAAFTFMALLSAMRGLDLSRAEAGLDGGRLGWGLARISGGLFHPLGLVGIILHSLILSIIEVFFLAWGFGWLGKLWRQLQGDVKPALPTIEPVVSVSPLPRSVSGESAPPASRDKPARLPAEFRKKFRISDAPEPTAAPLPPRDDRLPSLEILVQETAFKPDERNINLTAGLIEKTLAEFGIPAKVVGFRIGPTVTQFAVEPGFLEKNASEGDAAKQKVRVAQIAALNRDLALALSAERLRIEAPVPGRPYIGIEVPNTRSAIVRLRPILESEAFAKIASPLAIALGRDVAGNPVVGDLSRMPHLLIAGTTGSGKSVCIAAITTCLVMNNPPEDLRLIMIDPKMVELVRFNGLPHLLGKVETKLDRILGVLRWTVAEMDRRYKILEATHSRNLETYNKKARRRKDISPLPHIVLIIDELADLMMSAPEQTEPALIRLAQLARATGIHLVVATQRPSTDVVTGLIKANFPARIAFAVASSVDSRVILDTVGAEALLGHGDMLFLPPEASAPLRCQGVMISDAEIERVITYWQAAQPRQEGETAPWEEFLRESAILEDHDALIEEAIKMVSKMKRVSTSLLQRRLRIGYPRAARLMDELEEMGIVGPLTAGSRDREVLIGEDAGYEDEEEI